MRIGTISQPWENAQPPDPGGSIGLWTRCCSALRKLGSWQRLHETFGKRVSVLGYHHVGPAKPGTFPGLTVSPERFERQMFWLKRNGYTGISPRQWLEWRRDGVTLPGRPVVVTFDDGYADIARYALPVLKRLGFSAAVFEVTGEIGGTNTWDQASGSAPHALLDEQQIRYWADRGIEFGSHSRTHPDLTTLSARQLGEEVAGSAEDLRAVLGRLPVSFAYPHGRWSKAVRDRVEQTYALAYTSEETLNNLHSDAFTLGRATVESNDSNLDIRCRIAIGFSPIPWLRERVGLRTRMRAFARQYHQQQGSGGAQ